MKYKKLFAVIAVLILLTSLIVATSYTILNKTNNKEFYAGVTYGGDSVQEAKELIDKVKDYTNIFILASGGLRMNLAFAEEIGDYAIASDLNYAVFGGLSDTVRLHIWLNEAKERWGEHFVGVYYDDEPGGKLLDSGVILEWTIEEGSMSNRINKDAGGVITFRNDKTTIKYWPDGRITVQIADVDEVFDQGYSSSPQGRQLENGTIIGSYKRINGGINYYPNGTIVVEENIGKGAIWHRIWDSGSASNNQAESERVITNFYTTGNITSCPYEIRPYEEVLNQNPIQNYNDIAKAYVNVDHQVQARFFLNKTELEESILVFTSDYGLYWWDYQKGYDLVLAELGWNHSVAQHIGLVRGAANLQNKSWGTIITWKYTQAPFLADGNEIYEQMKTSYEAGAEYAIIFNYSEDKTNPNTLQEEHF